MKYHFIPVRMAIIKKSINSAGEGLEKRESSYTMSENVNWYSLYGKNSGGSFKN